MWDGCGFPHRGFLKRITKGDIVLLAQSRMSPSLRFSEVGLGLRNGKRAGVVMLTVSLYGINIAIECPIVAQRLSFFCTGTAGRNCVPDGFAEGYYDEIPAR